MKRSNIIIILVFIIAILSFFLIRKFSSPVIEIERNETIDQTPNIITEVKNIGNWEFLSIKIEILVDTTKGKFFKDQLSAIYTGTLRYGIDCATADNWLSQKNDTVIAFLPKVKLLDDYFLDEAATRTVFESGSFTPKDRQDLRDRAIKRILAKSERLEYRKTAQTNAKEQISNFLQQLGIKNIVYVESY